MKVQVSVNNVRIIEPSILNENEYNIHNCEFEFTEEYNGLTKKAVFTNEANETYVETIVDNMCSIPSEVLKDKENVKLGVYAYDVDNEELLLRYSPRPTEFYVHEGSYKEGQNSTPPTPSEIEQLQAQITENANDIDGIIGDIVDINSDIVDIKAEQITQNNNIQTNANNISTINGQIITINQDIDNLERTKADKSEIPTKTSDLINDSDFVSDSEYVHTDNNFTDEDKTQITTNKNDIATLQSTKADKSEIPTKTSQLNNDSGFITKNVDDLANYYKKSEIYNKTEIDGKVSSVYKYKGTVATYQDLPSTDLTIGDVYNVEEDGSNYAWTGNSWDKLGGDIDLSEYYTKTQTDSLLSAKANSSDVYTKNETYNKTEVNTLLDGKVDKVQGKGLSSNDFTDNDKNQIEANQTAITNIKDGTTIDSFADVETALSAKEDVANKVTELTDESTDVEYPSAKCVYDELEAKQSEIDTLQQDVEDLRGACLSVEGTGTDITLNNTAQARLLKNELGGRTEQEQLSGKNLVNYAEATTTSVSPVTLGEFTNYEVGKTYTFSAKLDLGNTEKSGRIRMKIEYNDETPTSYVGSYVAGTGVKTSVATVTITDNIESIALQYQPNQTGIKYYDFQLEEGGEATSYEPYCGGIPSPNPDYPQAIKNVTGNANVKIQNKNLFDGQIELGSINPANGELQPSTARTRSKNFIKVKPNTTYTISVQTGQYRWIIGYTADKIGITDGNVDGQPSAISSFAVSIYSTTNTFTTTATTEYIKWYDTSSTDLTEKVQIEQGSTATSYVAHQEQNLPVTLGNIELCKIGNYQDYFYKENGKWYLHNEILKKVYNGTENWELNGTYNCPSIRFGEVLNKKAENSLSNYFIEKSAQLLATEYGMYTKYSGILFVGFPNATITEFKTWLSIHNLILYIGTDTPINTEITDTTLIEQLEATLQARSYDDITYITSESDELGFNMYVESLANANKVIDNQNNEIDTIKSRLDLLEG